MEYQIRLSDEADAELDDAFLFLLQRAPQAAYGWYQGAQAAVDSLSVFPGRCPLARENDAYPDNEVRQLLYGQGRSAYRILFTVFEDDAEVRILQFRHAARRMRSEAQEDA